MEEAMNNDLIQNDKLLKILLNYYNWEKEKENLLFNKEKNIHENKEKYYLIDKKVIDNFKNCINYENLKKKIEIEKLENNSVKIEEIIKKYIQKEKFKINDFDLVKFDSNSFIKKNNIINSLLSCKDCNFEIINEEVKNSLFVSKELIYDIHRKDIQDKLIFETSDGFNNLFILIFPFGDDYIGKLFFILKSNDINNEYLEKKFEEKNESEILKSYNIDLNYIKENEYKGYEACLNSETDKYNYTIIASKIKFIKYSFDPNNKTQIILTNNYNYENKKEEIELFFNCLKQSNEKFNSALKSSSIRNNYSPCKIIDKNWMEDFINMQNISVHKNDEFKKLIRNFKMVTQDNIEKGEFFIIDENCFVCLFPLIYKLEKNKDNFSNYQIYLNKNNKGAIIIKENIYIFQTQNDVNKRYNYEKIQNVNKYKYLYEMEVNSHYELTDEKWNELKNSNKKEVNFGGKLNENKKTCDIISDDSKEINILLDSLQKREKELNVIKENLKKKELELNKKLKEINDNKKVILNKNLPTLGLQNLGATCYMNAVLQCIAHFHEVSEEILTWYKYSNDENKKNKRLSYAFAEVLDNLYIKHQNQNQNINIYNYNSLKNDYAPSYFKRIVGELNPLFKGIQANDSKDMMNFIIEKIHEELNPLREISRINNNSNYIIDQTNELITFNNFKNEFINNYHSVLSDYLYGLQKTVTLCCNCSTMIFNFQTYNFLIFPLLDVKNFVVLNNCNNPFFNMQNYVLTLNDCFKYYQKIEFFTGVNQIFCNKCKCLQNANYCNMLYNVPTILCIVLNRGKDNKDFLENIMFGTQLDLSEFIQDKNDLGFYYLIGVVVHVGDSSMSGHFFAYCRSHFKSPWYKYNDSIVSLSNENEIYSVGKPYILFYHKYQ